MRDQEEEIIKHWRKARKFNPGDVNDWLEFILKSIALAAMVITFAGTGFAYLFPLLAPDWANLPDSVRDNTLAVESLNVRLAREVPTIVDFQGGLLVTQSQVSPGDSVTVVAVLRRNVSCETNIRVRFFDHSDNIINQKFSYLIPSVRAPITSTFIAFPIRVFIPDNLPTGTYSYFPEIIPLDCGVYKTIVPPMSDPFYVTEGV